MEIISYIIVALGIINILRMFLLSIVGDWYEISFFSYITGRTKEYKPSISILIPAHNEDKVIERCLNSVYASTYRRFEVVVVDDGSTDKTLQVVKKYIKESNYKNIRLLTQPNKGKAHALNNALRNNSLKTLVMTLDADSMLHPRALENSTAYFSNSEIAAVASNVRIVKTWSLLGMMQEIEYLVGHKLKKAYTYMGNEYIIEGIGAVFRKKILTQVSYYDTDTMTEDIDVTMKIISKGGKKRKVIFARNVLTFTEPVARYRDLYKQRLRWKFGRMQTLYKQRRLFFNSNKKYTKSLTMFQLPFIIFSEITFLFDPLFVLFVFYYIIRFQDIETLRWMFFFLWFYTSITIVMDEYLKIGEKFMYLLFTPLSYIFFGVIGWIEYVGLLQSVLSLPKLKDTSTTNFSRWSHVMRTG